MGGREGEFVCVNYGNGGEKNMQVCVCLFVSFGVCCVDSPCGFVCLCSPSRFSVPAFVYFCLSFSLYDSSPSLCCRPVFCVLCLSVCLSVSFFCSFFSFSVSLYHLLFLLLYCTILLFCVPSLSLTFLLHSLLICICFRSLDFPFFFLFLPCLLTFF